MNVPESERVAPQEWLAALAGGGPFDEVGREFRGYLTGLCGLDPDDAVLEAGCGAGRIAIPLTGYLSTNGRYEGFDVLPWAVDWCTNEITSRYPNFSFRHADVFSGQYYPEGRLQPSEYTFPFDTDQFDVAYATSLFTHVLPDGVERYVSEMARVLKAGGRLLMTFYLLNDESLHSIEAGGLVEECAFTYPRGRCRVTYDDAPEFAVALDEEFVVSTCEGSGLRVNDIRYGEWSGRSSFLSWQDILLAELL